MSEPQTPPAPPTAPAEKKGLSPLAWVLIGCLGLLLIGFMAAGACTYFVGKKVADVAEDFAENPARTAAEMVVKLNPELEIVDSDDEAETLTIRNKETGEEMTLDWSEIERGNFSFSSDEGSFSIDATGESGSVVTMTDGEGSSTQYYGTGHEARIPDWIPVAEGAGDVESTFSTTSGDEVSGAFSYTTSATVSEALEFYVDEMTSAGYEISQNNYSGGGRSGGGVSGTNEAEGRTLNVGVAGTDSGTQVTISYSESH